MKNELKELKIDLNNRIRMVLLVKVQLNNLKSILSEIDEEV